MKVMLITHVDDMAWAAKPGYEFMIEKILKLFDMRKIVEDEFRFCGREVVQDAEGNITVTCKSTTESILPVNFRVEGRSPEDKALDHEVSQLRSVTGSIAWICRQCRPALSYLSSRMQSIASAAQVKHLTEANRVVLEAQAGADDGLFFKTKAFDWNTAILISIADASWAGETKYVDDKIFPRRSQMGRVIVLAEPSLWTSDTGQFHAWSWKSTMIARVCRSTFHAETKANVKRTEEAQRLRAAYADVRGLLDRKNWEETANNAMKHLWLTDCESVSSFLNNPAPNGVDDKRLLIDLEGQRQMLWEDAQGNPKDTLEEKQTDKIRWIDTSTMLADPLTKAMKADRMVKAFMTGFLDLVPTDASVMSKMMKQKGRAKARGEEQVPEEPEEQTWQ